MTERATPAHGSPIVAPRARGRRSRPPPRARKPLHSARRQRRSTSFVVTHARMRDARVTRACYLTPSARHNDLTSYPGHRLPMKGDQHEALRRARRCRFGACVHRAPARVRRETEAERTAVGGDDTERDVRNCFEHSLVTRLTPALRWAPMGTTAAHSHLRCPVHPRPRALRPARALVCARPRV